ncbi:MAG: D-2-hydroxyacid dehydrogenase [Bacteroidaceae bacterium]|nr:D-2-hydroxyacid dehydrogenase [Bacteroidaceae bacterium]
MKIVVLDGFAANPGDISWESLQQLGECVIYDRTSPAELMERAAGAEVLLTNKVIISAEAMKNLPQLKYVGVLATGYNVVDIKAAAELGIIVTNVPAYSTYSVAQMVFAHLLNITHHVAHHADAVRQGRWSSNPDFCFWDYPLIELMGLKMGVVGLGNTGTATAKIAQAMGMEVHAYTSKAQDQLPEGFQKSTLEDLFKECDVISLNCPLTENTKHLVNAERLALMKPTAILINTGRGPLVNDQDVADALNEGRIQAFAADVMTVEPPSADNPLLSAKNCFLTPHVAWATTAARQRLMQIAVANVKAFQEGKPQNVIN